MYLELMPTARFQATRVFVIRKHFRNNASTYTVNIRTRIVCVIVVNVKKVN